MANVERVLTESERDAYRVIALLVHQLGGRVTLTDYEMQEFDGHLTLKQYYDSVEGRVFETKEKRS